MFFMNQKKDMEKRKRSNAEDFQIGIPKIPTLQEERKEIGLPLDVEKKEEPKEEEIVAEKEKSVITKEEEEIVTVSAPFSSPLGNDCSIHMENEKGDKAIQFRCILNGFQSNHRTIGMLNRFSVDTYESKVVPSKFKEVDTFTPRQGYALLCAIEQFNHMKTIPILYDFYQHEERDRNLFREPLNDFLEQLYNSLCKLYK